jgi:hypothetical protein
MARPVRRAFRPAAALAAPFAARFQRTLGEPTALRIGFAVAIFAVCQRSAGNRTPTMFDFRSADRKEHRSGNTGVCRNVSIRASKGRKYDVNAAFSAARSRVFSFEAGGFLSPVPIRSWYPGSAECLSIGAERNAAGTARWLSICGKPERKVCRGTAAADFARTCMLLKRPQIRHLALRMAWVMHLPRTAS